MKDVLKKVLPTVFSVVFVSFLLVLYVLPRKDISALVPLPTQAERSSLNPVNLLQKSEQPLIERSTFSFAPLNKRLQPACVEIAAIVAMEQPQMLRLPPGIPMPGGPGGPANPGGPGGLEDFFKEFFDNNPEEERTTRSLGSGVIVDPRGYIVTNHHVVRGAKKIKIKLNDGSMHEAKLVGADKTSDIAYLKIEAGKELTAAPWGNSDEIEVGDWVLAIGNPLNVGKTITAGIISARGRDLGRSYYDDYLQTDAAINQGNSGGGLFDLNGQLIGIPTAIASPSGANAGIGFAIPSNLAKNVVEQLVAYGHVKRGVMGVKIRELGDTPEKALATAKALGMKDEKGALVDTVVGQSAKDAGILPGDVITKFDGKPITNSKMLPPIVANTKIGKEVDVELWRTTSQGKGDLKTLKLKISEMKVDDNDEVTLAGASPARPEKVEEVKIEDLGVTVTTLTDELRTSFKMNSKLVGVFVSKVDRTGPLAQHFIEPGAVIVEVNQKLVQTPKDIVTIVNASKKQQLKVITMLVEQKGDRRFVAVQLGSKDDE